MYYVALAHPVDFSTWRTCSRWLIQNHVRPEAIQWAVEEGGVVGLLQEGQAKAQWPQSTTTFSLSRQWYHALQLAIQHRREDRFGLMYKALFAHIENKNHTVPDSLNVLVHEVIEETDRFREDFVARADHLTGEAFFDVQHYILEANAHFCIAVQPKPWCLKSSYRQMRWDGEVLFFDYFPKGREISTDKEWYEDGRTPWIGYPHSELPPSLAEVRHAPTVDVLHAQAMDCQHCALWHQAQRTVFGEGAKHASVMFVGEQPGDQEDREGRPFVGPAGQVFDRALEEQHIDRDDCYITNAVKHFRFFWRADRRLHQKPDPVHIESCRVWLQEECRLVQPRLIVLLGATAAQSVLHRRVGVLRERGHIFLLGKGISAMITAHPSYVLRQPSQEEKDRAYSDFCNDIKEIRSFLDDEKEPEIGS